MKKETKYIFAYAVIVNIGIITYAAFGIKDDRDPEPWIFECMANGVNNITAGHDLVDLTESIAECIILGGQMKIDGKECSLAEIRNNPQEESGPRNTPGRSLVPGGF